jgi:hypothetical protein
MNRVYPQDASNSISGVLRQDEKSDGTQQSDLAGKQQLGTLGETIPLAFALRRNDKGGTWVSPHLIQLGIKQTDISLLYVLSQGRVSEPVITNVFYGYAGFNTITNGQICSGYQALPPCVSLDYNPGGSTSWDTTVSYSGPGLPSAGNTSEFTTRTETCVKITLTISGTCTVSPPGGSYVVNNFHLSPGVVGYGDPSGSAVASQLFFAWYEAGISNEFDPRGVLICRTDTIFNRSVDLSIRSEVRYDYQVWDVKANAIVRSGQVWVPDGGTTLSIESLPSAQYKLVLSSFYAERSHTLATFVPQPHGYRPGPGYADREASQYENNAINGRLAWAHQNRLQAQNGTFMRNIAGSSNQSFKVEVLETVRTTLNFPTVPGGSNQQQGGYTDLTLLGARGHYDSLRPADGPQQFTQIHAFLTEGVQVPRLLQGKTTGPSDLYPDLVHYLMNMAGMLKSDQIDLDGLTLSALFTEKYKLLFNGVLAVTVNFREWLSRTAPYFVLTPRQVNGKFGLMPAIPTKADGTIDEGQVVPVATFDASDIVAGSYQKNWVPAADRKPFVAVMVFREQPAGSVGQSRTVEVRYQGMAASGPYEQHDLTEFCCTPEHAVYAARYILAKRRHVSHEITFTALRKASLLLPGQIISVAVTTQASDGTSATVGGLYQIEQLNESQEGTVEVHAIEFPVNDAGVSRVAYDVARGDVVILQ